jgi:hypothetical protein
MTIPNGQESASTYVNGTAKTAPPSLPSPGTETRLSDERIQELVRELEIPFDPSVIEWRVTNTAKGQGRGQVIPYADQRAYTDRLNALFTPAGWTRKYSFAVSPHFERGKEKRSACKVFVTCNLTIFGVGEHSATGEEWADDDNAGTSAEAQAFKRASSCFGLGRYLYHFVGAWVELDERKRPKKNPGLPGWATPDGWRRGLRPGATRAAGVEPERPAELTRKGHSQEANRSQNADNSLVREIEQMQDSLGTHMYRGLLRRARAWKAAQIANPAIQRKTLDRMQAADRGFRRLEAALEGISEETLTRILKSLGIRAIDRLDSLEVLHKLVLELEASSKR